MKYQRLSRVETSGTISLGHRELWYESVRIVDAPPNRRSASDSLGWFQPPYILQAIFQFCSQGSLTFQIGLTSASFLGMAIYTL